MVTSEIIEIQTKIYNSPLQISNINYKKNICCIQSISSKNELHIGVLNSPNINLLEKIKFDNEISNFLLEISQNSDFILVVSLINYDILIYTFDFSSGILEISQTTKFPNAKFICFDQTVELFILQNLTTKMLELFETFSGNFVNKSQKIIGEFENFQDAVFCSNFPHILVGIHSDYQQISFWNMKEIEIIKKIELENIPLKIHTNQQNQIIITSIDGKIECYSFILNEETNNLTISKEFILDCEMLEKGGLDNSNILGCGNYLILSGSDSTKFINISAKNIINNLKNTEKHILGEFLFNKFDIIIFSDTNSQQISIKTYEVPSILPPQEEIKEISDQIPVISNPKINEENEIKEIEQSILQKNDEISVISSVQDMDLLDKNVNNMYIDVLKESEKANNEKSYKKWNCQSALQALEKNLPSPNSILISSNIQIKEKSIYDTSKPKEIAKSKKKGGPPDLSISIFCNYLKNIDHPVTFHTKIKSSGYGKAPDSLKYAPKKKKLSPLKNIAPKKLPDFYSQSYPILKYVFLQ